MNANKRLLMKFARAMLAKETCQQGGPLDTCRRPAAYESVHSGHLMCSACVRAWYPMTDWEIDEEDESDVIWKNEMMSSGLLRKTRKGWEKKIEARRRDDPEAHEKLPTEAVEVILLLEKAYRPSQTGSEGR